jgi:hypothetical protein
MNNYQAKNPHHQAPWVRRTWAPHVTLPVPLQKVKDALSARPRTTQEQK